MNRETVKLRGGYRTTREQRIVAMLRRDRLRAAGICINGERHGPATHGVLCARCRIVHSGRLEPQSRGDGQGRAEMRDSLGPAESPQPALTYSIQNGAM